MHWSVPNSAMNGRPVAADRVIFHCVNQCSERTWSESLISYMDSENSLVILCDVFSPFTMRMINGYQVVKFKWASLVYIVWEKFISFNIPSEIPPLSKTVAVIRSYEGRTELRISHFCYGSHNRLSDDDKTPSSYIWPSWIDWSPNYE